MSWFLRHHELSVCSEVTFPLCHLYLLLPPYHPPYHSFSLWLSKTLATSVPIINIGSLTVHMEEKQKTTGHSSQQTMKSVQRHDQLWGWRLCFYRIHWMPCPDRYMDPKSCRRSLVGRAKLLQESCIHLVELVGARAQQAGQTFFCCVYSFFGLARHSIASEAILDISNPQLKPGVIAFIVLGVTSPVWVLGRKQGTESWNCGSRGCFPNEVCQSTVASHRGVV